MRKAGQKRTVSCSMASVIDHAMTRVLEMSNSDQRPRWALYYALVFCFFFCPMYVLLFLSKGPNTSLTHVLVLSLAVSVVVTLLWMALRGIFVKLLERKGSGT